MWLSKFACIILSIILVKYVKYMSDLQQSGSRVLNGVTGSWVLPRSKPMVLKFPIPNV